jgi:hypothetical protein
LVAIVASVLVACGSSVSTPYPTARLTAVPIPSPTAPARPSPSPAPTGPFWVIDAASYPGATTDLVSAIEALPVRPSTGTLFEVSSLLVVNDWAIAWAGVVPLPSAMASPTETAVVIGHLVGGSWILTTDRDPTFCAVLAQSPQAIANDEERAYFVGCK